MTPKAWEVTPFAPETAVMTPWAFAPRESKRMGNKEMRGAKTIVLLWEWKRKVEEESSKVVTDGAKKGTRSDLKEKARRAGKNEKD